MIQLVFIWHMTLTGSSDFKISLTRKLFRELPVSRRSDENSGLLPEVNEQNSKGTLVPPTGYTRTPGRSS